jgi:hypothetical protein
MKMPEPKAWIRGSGLEMLKLENGGVATVFASNGMSNNSQPLYDKQALIDLLEQAAQLAEGPMHFSNPIAADLRSMKEKL